MGLYEGSDVAAKVYWEARAAAETLEAALATGQPWNAIAAFVPEALARFDAALAASPDPDVLAWRARAAAIEARVDPANDTRWGRGFPWGQRPFVEGWIALQQARLLRGSEAHWAARRALAAWQGCFNLDDWSADARRLLRAGLEEAGRIAAEERP